MSFLAEVSTGVAASLIAGIIIAKTADLLRNKEVISSVMAVIKSKGVINITTAYLSAIEAIFDASLPKNIIYRSLIISINSSLLLSISKIAEQIVKSNINEKKSKTVVGLMLSDKLKRSSTAQIFLLSAFLINIFTSLFTETPFNSLVIVIVSICLLVIHIDHKLIEYRLKNGWYGKNEFETREIIEFIISHSDKNDFNDSGGLKKVVPRPELSDEEKPVTNIEGITT